MISSLSNSPEGAVQLENMVSHPFPVTPPTSRVTPAKCSNTRRYWCYCSVTLIFFLYSSISCALPQNFYFLLCHNYQSAYDIYLLLSPSSCGLLILLQTYTFTHAYRRWFLIIKLSNRSTNWSWGFGGDRGWGWFLHIPETIIYSSLFHFLRPRENLSICTSVQLHSPSDFCPPCPHPFFINNFSYILFANIVVFEYFQSIQPQFSYHSSFFALIF